MMYYGFLTPAFSEVSFPPEFIFRQFAKLFIILDKFIYKFFPKGILKYSWKYGRLIAKSNSFLENYF